MTIKLVELSDTLPKMLVAVLGEQGVLEAEAVLVLEEEELVAEAGLEAESPKPLTQ